MARRQGYDSRMDESLGMRRGRESGKMQSYKSRRDESYGMSNTMGNLGHEKNPRKIDPFSAQRSDMGRVRKIPSTNRGYPSEAWNYQY